MVCKEMLVGGNESCDAKYVIQYAIAFLHLIGCKIKAEQETQP